jgi:hypothetical protein
MTTKQLRDLLLQEAEHFGPSFWERELHVVHHGYNSQSFNVLATSARTGANHNDFLVICEEER